MNRDQQSPCGSIVIVGATSDIAKQCARLWVERGGADLFLVGRNEVRLERVAADLRVRNPGINIEVIASEALDPEAIQAVVNNVANRGEIKLAVIAHGSLPEQSRCQDELEICAEALQVNGVSTVLYAEAFAKRMARWGSGTIVLLGSVAGDRGRKSNYVYGAAKGLVTRYVEGLQHRFYNTGVRVILVKPGPTATSMTAHMTGVRLAPVESVARQIVEGIDQGKSVVYAPKKWFIIMGVIRHLPAVVFNRLNI